MFSDWKIFELVTKRLMFFLEMEKYRIMD